MISATQLTNQVSDRFIDDVARVSFNQHGTKRSPEEINRLVKFLVREKHWSPIGHPMLTLVANEKVLPERALLQEKFLLAGLNIHYADGKVFITSGVWGFFQLAVFLKSSEIFDILGVLTPFATDAFLHYHEPETHTCGKRLFKVSDTTPEKHQWATFRIKAPLPIRSQDFKHKQGFLDNEISRRYVKTLPELHNAPKWRSKPANAKQGSGGRMYLSGINERLINCAMGFSVNRYEKLIALGVAPEQARFILPQAMVTEYIRTGTREAWENYFSLRCKPDAQHEIQELAMMIRDTIKYQG